MQLREGLGSPGVGFGVRQVRALAVAYSGQYKLAGATAPPFVVGDLILRRNKKGGASVQMLETQKNSAKDSLRVIQIARVLYVKTPTRARFAWTWADSGWFQPITVHHFPFSFSTKLREFLGNSRKMIKIWDQFY